MRDTQIEKDYIPTWILTGVSQNTLLYNSLAFKGGTRANKKVKVDISRTEHLCFDLEDRPLFDSYSDQGVCKIRCYSLNEAMAEKMRSLLSRTQPRDYYDLWYLSEIEGMEMADFRNEFEMKARHKGLDPDSLSAKIDSKVNVFKSRWENSMKDQIAELPPFEQVHRELGKHFRLLFK